MPKRAQTHEIVSRQGWLSYHAAAVSTDRARPCKLQALRRARRSIRSAIRPAACTDLCGEFRHFHRAGRARALCGAFRPARHLVRRGGGLTEQPRRIGLAVTRDSEVLHLPLPAIREIVAADPGAWRFFGLAAIAHYDLAIGAADDLLIRDHVKRSVAVLLRLGGCRYRTPPGRAAIEVDVSQEDFAAMTNWRAPPRARCSERSKPPAPSRSPTAAFGSCRPTRCGRCWKLTSIAKAPSDRWSRSVPGKSALFRAQNGWLTGARPILRIRPDRLP